MVRASASDRDEVAKTSHRIVDNPRDDWRSCYRSFYLLSLLEPDTGAEWQRLCPFATLNSRYGNCPGPTAKHFHPYPDTVPEGDTIFRTAATLREALVGKTLTRCDVRVPRYATTDLTGHTVDEVLSRGKHLFIRVGPASIHSHLKMDGSWRISPRGVPDHKIRILLRAGSTTAAGVDLGILEILDRAQDQDAVAHLGPDLLGDDWDPDHAAANLTADPDRALAEALLDQRVMAGVGNVYCNELCFVFGRLPTSPVAALPDPLRLVARARDMLWANRARQNRTTTGDTRRGSELWVYGREGRPCRRCGTPIARSAPQPADRVSYWCPSCQR